MDPEVQRRCADLAQGVIETVEAAFEELAVDLIKAVATHRKQDPFELALCVPGVCHQHLPCKSHVPGCHYCQRRGNCFDGR